MQLHPYLSFNDPPQDVARVALGMTGIEQMGVQLAELELMLLLVVGSWVWLGPSVPKQV